MNKRVLVPLLLLYGCGGKQFGDDFVFGTAVAGFQIEMGCPTLPAAECEDTHSDWYTFITSTTAIARSSNLLQGDPPSFGPGYYELWEQDLDRASALGLRGFRFSIEWSRVFPESTVGIEGTEALDQKASRAALDYYRAQLTAMRARGLEPLVTLNHYTLPSWLHDAVGCNQDLDHCTPRGWLEPYAVGEIAKYAGFAAAKLGDLVDTWATENEPLAVVVPGYLQSAGGRTNPPAVSFRFAEAKTVLLNMIRAHAAMYDAIHLNDPNARVGIVYNVAPTTPKDANRGLDVRAAKNVFYLYNELFLNAVVNGVLDDDLDGRGEPHAELAGKSDYLGVNYYTRLVVEGEEDSLAPAFSPLATFNPLTTVPSGVDAKGLYDTAMAMKERYPSVPLIITENGADSRAGDATPFLVEHLEWLKKAIDDGAKVEGYYWWSLMDNYEWNNGMTYQFGLFAVDPHDPMKARVKRPVADAYQRIVAARGVPDDLAKAHPIED